MWYNKPALLRSLYVTNSTILQFSAQHIKAEEK